MDKKLAVIDEKYVESALGLIQTQLKLLSEQRKALAVEYEPLRQRYEYISASINMLHPAEFELGTLLEKLRTETAMERLKPTASPASADQPDQRPASEAHVSPEARRPDPKARR